MRKIFHIVISPSLSLSFPRTIFIKFNNYISENFSIRIVRRCRAMRIDNAEVKNNDIIKEFKFILIGSSTCILWNCGLMLVYRNGSSQRICVCVCVFFCFNLYFTVDGATACWFMMSHRTRVSRKCIISVTKKIAGIRWRERERERAFIAFR